MTAEVIEYGLCLAYAVVAALVVRREWRMRHVYRQRREFMKEYFRESGERAKAVRERLGKQ